MSTGRRANIGGPYQDVVSDDGTDVIMSPPGYACDHCGTLSTTVRSVGRDANGEPDAPDLCATCLEALCILTEVVCRSEPSWCKCDDPFLPRQTP